MSSLRRRATPGSGSGDSRDFRGDRGGDDDDASGPTMLPQSRHKKMVHLIRNMVPGCRILISLLFIVVTMFAFHFYQGQFQHVNINIQKKIESNNSTNREQESMINDIIKNELPEWLQSYLSWHKSKRAELAEMDKGNYSIMEIYNLTRDLRFLAVVCFQRMRCGGTADRMQSFPYWLMKANQTNRVLMIHWNKDNIPLSDYLIPPPEGMDWMVPSDKSTVSYKLLFEGNSCLKNESPILNNGRGFDKHGKRKLVCVEGHVYSFPRRDQKYYHNRNGQNSYPYAFQTMFQPSPALAKYIEQQMIQMHDAIEFDMNLSDMSPYLAVHIRSKYPLSNRLKNGTNEVVHLSRDKENYYIVAYLADHAVDVVIEEYQSKTGSHSIPPIYVASDNPDIIHYLREDSVLFGGARNNATDNEWQFDETPMILALDENETRTHINFVDLSAKKEGDKDLFNIFFDLWMLRSSRCIAYGVGGYGLLAATISISSQGCQINHQPSEKLYKPLAAAAKKYWTERNLTSHFLPKKSIFA